MTARRLFTIAIGLLFLGVVSFALQPVLDPKPDSECVADGEPSSGFTDEDKSDCNVSQESYDEITDWETKPKPLRILGLLLIVGGLVVGVVAVIRRARGRGPTNPG